MTTIARRTHPEMESTATVAYGRTTASLRMWSLAVPLALLSLMLASGASGGRTVGCRASQPANPTVRATQLVNRFFVLLARKDRAGLQGFLSPGFQVQRADGSAAEKQDYLANLATINKFQITRLRATRADGTLVVRYLAQIEGSVNGKPYTPGPAPRLSVFVWNGKRWQLAAHANFNPLTG
jgi:Domain of unknown function (DUF4440)